ncbi:hypothetical protein G7046_g8007 [Stylonectria norvegica]|nr:hypothetical protein G7046_g8007 [Stylonectria norvegica]
MNSISDTHLHPGIINSDAATTLEAVPMTSSGDLPPKLSQIGFGHCGSVWGSFRLPSSSSPDLHLVVKREDASPGRDIKNEALVQSLICATTNLSRLSVPRYVGFVENDHRIWEGILPLLPVGFQRCRAMISEKIPSVSVQGKQLLVDKYAPPRLLQTRSDIKGWLNREHCLVRIYLGRQRRQTCDDQGGRKPQFFSLRNFAMHVDQAEELGLSCEDYARAMAEALATLHWQLRIDGADIEFVLGGHRRERPGPEDDNNNTPLAEHAVWMLDYDWCATFRANETGFESIARAFWRNDPYYPRPGSLDETGQKLWGVFAAEYVRVGTQMVKLFPRQNEKVETLVGLVAGAIEKIIETKPIRGAGALDQ